MANEELRIKVEETGNKKPAPIRPGGGGPVHAAPNYGSNQSTSDLEVKKLRSEV